MLLMSVDHSDFLGLAKSTLVGDAAAEINFRNATSRGYYSVYHYALPVGGLLPDHCGTIGVRGGSHEKLAKRFSEFPKSMDGFSEQAVMDIRAAGIMLTQLKTRRRQADYQITEPFTKEGAESDLRFAEKIIKKLADIESSLLSSAASA